MMAALWSDVFDDLASAKKHFQQAVAIFSEGALKTRSEPDYVHEMAFLHAMQSGYTSFETGLKRIFSLLDEALPVGRDSHAALLKRASRPLEASRPAILDPALFGAASELRGFRHVAMHTYDYFDADRAAAAVKAAQTFLTHLDPAIARFRAAIDPD